MLFSNSDFPVDNETREWLDARISWIVDQFGMRQIRSRSTVTIQQELFNGYSPEDDASLRLVLDRLCRDLEIRSELVEYTIREEELISRNIGTALGTYLVVQVVAASKPSCERKSRSAYGENCREIGTSIWCGVGIGMIFAGLGL